MTYTDLLSQEEWLFKCNEILRRDNFRCCDCGCIGFHNGGNFMEFDNIAKIDELLEGYGFIFNDKGQKCDMFFSHYYEKILGQDDIIKRITNFPIKCDIKLEYEDLVYAHFSKPYHSKFVTYVADGDYFPIIFKKGEMPLEVKQRNLNWCIKTCDNDGIGELYEFLLPYSINSIYVCIEEYGVRNYITIQIKDKLFAIVFAKIKKLFKGLNIHHKYYLAGYKPWEYNNDALVTLCEDCHQKRHQQTSIPVYKSGRICRCLSSCSRCGGSGYLSEYSYYKDGICFECGGEGVALDEILYDK